MSKWRPSPKSIYVIADIHGQLQSLNLILKRILPLREQDELIFLGDYIDRGPDSAGVINRLIELKTLFDNQITFIRGNHEDLLLKSMNVYPWGELLNPYGTWMQNGGIQCAESYAIKNKIDPKQVYSMNQFRIQEIIFKDHIDFIIDETKFYYETEDYIFCHAGIDPLVATTHQDTHTLMWDRSLFQFMQNNRNFDAPWEKTIICGHSWLGPLITPKYMMLDCLRNNKLLCLELNSMEAFYAIGDGRKRMLKVSLKI